MRERFIPLQLPKTFSKALAKTFFAKTFFAKTFLAKTFFAKTFAENCAPTPTQAAA
jgi:hypothetical protein